VKIAIASGKGGTGKTTLAVNLASLIGNEMPEEQVILVDLDVEEPNSGLFFNQHLSFNEVVTRIVPGWDQNKCTLCGQCQEVCKFNAIAQLPNQLLFLPELCHSCFACIDLCPEKSLSPVKRNIGTIMHYKAKKLDLIESKLIVGEPSGISLIKQTKAYLEPRFSSNSLFIFDCPPGNSCPVIESVKGVDFVMLVTEPTPFGLNDLRIAVETMNKLGLEYGVVINKSDKSGDPVSEYCLQNDVFILGTIRHNRALAEIAANGELTYSRFSDFRNALNSIYMNVLNRMSATCSISEKL
jgi:MinD superfamily P-loop ATPase